jgi:Na+/alanine symporter
LDYPEVANYMKRSAEQAAYQFTPMEKQAMKKQWGKFEKAVKTLMVTLTPFSLLIGINYVMSLSVRYLETVTKWCCHTILIKS